MQQIDRLLVHCFLIPCTEDWRTAFGRQMVRVSVRGKQWMREADIVVCDSSGRGRCVNDP